jgi:hypothetical protein
MKFKNAIPAPPHGIYILKQDIINPYGDRRHKHNYWRRPMWLKGQKFAIEFFDKEIAPGAECIRPIGGYNQLLFVSSYKDRLNLIVPNLEKVPDESLDEIMLAGKELDGISYKRVLDYLVESGCVSLNDVKRAIVDIKERKI